MSKIILYHQESCGMCKMAEMLLKQKSLCYESCMDTKEMEKLGIRSTPVLSIDDKLYYGVQDIKAGIEKFVKGE